MSNKRPVPHLSPGARQQAISELQDLAKRLGSAAHSIMQKAIRLSSEDRKDHEKAVRSMRRYRGGGQPDQSMVLEIEAALTGQSIAQCLAYTESQSSHIAHPNARKAVRPVDAFTLANHELDLVRLFREGTTAQRATILGILNEEAVIRQAKAEESARIGAEMDRRIAEHLEAASEEAATQRPAPKQPAVKRSAFTVIEGGAS